MNIYVEKLKVLFVCRYLIRRVRGRESDLMCFPVELFNVETERLKIECIHAVCGANYSRFSKTPTSNCMRETTSGVSVTGTQISAQLRHVFIFKHFIRNNFHPLFLQDSPFISEMKNSSECRKLFLSPHCEGFSVILTEFYRSICSNSLRSFWFVTAKTFKFKASFISYS